MQEKLCYILSFFRELVDFIVTLVRELRFYLVKFLGLVYCDTKLCYFWYIEMMTERRRWGKTVKRFSLNLSKHGRNNLTGLIFTKKLPRTLNVRLQILL